LFAEESPDIETEFALFVKPFTDKMDEVLKFADIDSLKQPAVKVGDVA
jgi:hypothetical protein